MLFFHSVFTSYNSETLTTNVDSVSVSEHSVAAELVQFICKAAARQGRVELRSSNSSSRNDLLPFIVLSPLVIEVVVTSLPLIKPEELWHCYQYRCL